MNVEDELKTYLQVLWRYKWMIAACAIIALIVALGISLKLTPIYKATSTMRVATAAIGASDYSYISSATRLSNTYVEIATSDISLDEVSKRLGLEIKKTSVEVEIVSDTELIKISASDPDPTRASDIANTLANLMVEQSSELYGGSAPTARQILETQLQQAKADLDKAVSDYDKALHNTPPSATPLASGTPLPTSTTLLASGTPIPNPDLDMLEHLVSVRQQIYGDLLQQYETARTNEQLHSNAITIVEPASPPKKPDSPNIPLNGALGLGAGLAMGVILAFIFEGMDDTLRGIEDVQAMTTLPILCRVPELRQRFRLDAIPAPAFDQLGARLILFDGKPKPATILITSPEPDSGKSTIAANLAVSLTQEGNRIVLVDMDFRRPRQHTILGLPNDRGLSNFMWGEIQLDAALQTTKRPELRVITAGSSSHIPYEWMTPLKVASLLEELSKECDYLLIDAPALLSVADPMVLASQADAVVLVAARRKTERQNLRYAIEQLTELKAKVAGIVINRMPNSPLYSYYARNNNHRSSSHSASKDHKPNNS